MSELHMLRMRLHQGKLMELGRRRGLPLREVDTGYLVHCALGELFGEDTPKPFAITDERGVHATVLGYAGKSKEALASGSAAFADPGVHASCDWETFESKKMPDTWEPGQRLGFDVRVAPVVRLAKGHEHHRKGAEVDAFLAKCWAVGESVQVDREQVYRDWFVGQLERHGGARLEQAAMTSFQRTRLVRRTKGEERVAKQSEQPAATLSGTLEVTESAAFSALLARGVGRHRSFGFGMLLLRRPG